MLWRQTLGNEFEGIKFRRPRQQMLSPRWETSLIDVQQNFEILFAIFPFIHFTKNHRLHRQLMFCFQKTKCRRRL